MPSFAACEKHGRHGERICALCSADVMEGRAAKSLRNLARCIQAEVDQDRRGLAKIDRELRRRGLEGL